MSENKPPIFVDYTRGDWCRRGICPCLTCELWLNDNLDLECACRPCNEKRVKRPQDVVCWKTHDNIRALDLKTMHFIPSQKEIAEHEQYMKGR